MNRMRTMLSCPASQPKMFLNAPVFHPDVILLDLEDAVVFAEKDSARDLLCSAMEQLDFGKSLVLVRINALKTPFSEADIRAAVPVGVCNLRFAMCESPEDVQRLAQLLGEVEEEHQIPHGSVKIQCSIETAKGVLNARETVRANPRVISLSFGMEDYTRFMGISRSRSAQKLQFARMYLPVAATEAGISAIDTTWGDLEDEAEFEAEVNNAKALGFSGKSCIHPSQLAVIHRIYTPSEAEVVYARRVIEAMQAAKQADVGVFTVDRKMVDAPIVAKAQRVLLQVGGEAS